MRSYSDQSAFVALSEYEPGKDAKLRLNSIACVHMYMYIIS